MRTYDDWKTDVPDNEEPSIEEDEEEIEPCGCMWEMNAGFRYLVERCDVHEALHAAAKVHEEMKQKDAAQTQENTEKDEDFPF